MPIHPQIADILAHIPPADGTRPDPAAVRAADELRVPAVEQRIPVHSVVDTVAATRAGDVPLRIYRQAGSAPAGVLVYLHGGAFFSGSLDTHDHVARSLSTATGLTVVSVGYRLAPEAAFPAGLTDCYGVVRWVTENADALGWDGERLIVAGDSSGGTFATAVTALAHNDGFDRITHQVLYYPSVDLDFDDARYASLRENARGYGLETVGLEPWNSFYVEGGADPADPLVSPIRREDLSGLPPALIITAEYDPLRDEGEAYGDRLREAGVQVTTIRWAGANHGFVQNFSWLPEFQPVFADTAAFLGILPREEQP